MCFASGASRAKLRPHALLAGIEPLAVDPTCPTCVRTRNKLTHHPPKMGGTAETRKHKRGCIQKCTRKEIGRVDLLLYATAARPLGRSTSDVHPDGHISPSMPPVLPASFKKADTGVEDRRCDWHGCATDTRPARAFCVVSKNIATLTARRRALLCLRLINKLHASARLCAEL